ncbi:MAG: hypothetical protein ACOCWM_06315 [Cyclobacteriaceae bacterium]
MKSPILITGAARSGTSMVAGIINICGAFGGEMSGPNINNAKGMFENARIRNTILKPYLITCGVDKMGQYPLPDVNNLMIPGNLKNKVQDVMYDQGYRKGPWMYKGPKMCLIWPIWHYAFPNAKWVIVRRRTGDIVNSCIKTGFMRAFANKQNQRAVGASNEREGWIWWVHQHEKRFIEMINEGLNVKIVWPERMLSGDYVQIQETIEWLGLNWEDNAGKVHEFIEPKLWKARKKMRI